MCMDIGVQSLLRIPKLKVGRCLVTEYRIDLLSGREDATVDYLIGLGYSVRREGGIAILEKNPEEFNKELLHVGPHLKRFDSNDHLLFFLEQNPPDQWDWPTKKSTSYRQIVGAVRNARDAKDITHFTEYLARAIVFSGTEQLRSTIIELALPAFFDRFPKGTVIPVSMDFRAFRWASAIRVLSLAGKYGNDIRNVVNPNGGIDPLKESHPDALPRLVSLLSFGLHLFYPFIHGFVVECRPGLLLAFLFDNPVEIVPRYPWDIYDITRQTGLWDEHTPSIDKDLLSGVDDDKQLYKRKTYGRLPTGTIEIWFSAWLGYLDTYIKDTFDFTNFVDATGKINCMDQLKYWHSMDRAVANTSLVNSDRNSMIRKTLSFQVCDILGNVMISPKGNFKKEGEAFSYLLSKRTFEEQLKRILTVLPEPFNDIFSSAGQEIYSDISQVALAGLWPIVKREEVGKLRLPIAPAEEKEYVEDDYVASLLRALRNTSHGYNTNQFDPLVLLHTGNISDYLGDVPLILLLCIITNPVKFRAEKWGFLNKP